MIIEIIDNDAKSLGRYSAKSFVSIPNINEEITIREQKYVVIGKEHEEIDDVSIFELILYVDKKVRGTK